MSYDTIRYNTRKLWRYDVTKVAEEAEPRFSKEAQKHV